MTDNEVVNGLADMQARRASRPLNRKKTELFIAQAPMAESVKPEPAPEPAPEPQPPKAPRTRSEHRKPRVAIKRPEVKQLRATQVLLDEVADSFISQVIGTAYSAEVKDISLSGIIRFALHRLNAEMSHEEVINAMLENPSALRHPGRRR